MTNDSFIQTEIQELKTIYNFYYVGIMYYLLFGLGCLKISQLGKTCSLQGIY